MGRMPPEQVTVSAKIPKKLKIELDKRGVNLSQAIRRGLENELKDKKVKEIESLLRKVDLSEVSERDIVRDIRATREER